MGVADGFYDMIDGLIGDIFRQSSKINRLAKHSSQEHYQVSCFMHLVGFYVAHYVLSQLFLRIQFELLPSAFTVAFMR